MTPDRDPLSPIARAHIAQARAEIAAARVRVESDESDSDRTEPEGSER